MSNSIDWYLYVQVGIIWYSVVYWIVVLDDWCVVYYSTNIIPIWFIKQYINWLIDCLIPIDTQCSFNPSFRASIRQSARHYKLNWGPDGSDPIRKSNSICNWFGSNRRIQYWNFNSWTREPIVSINCCYSYLLLKRLSVYTVHNVLYD